MSFPFKLIRVPGVDALARLAELRTAGGLYPVMIGTSESLERMLETLEENDETTVEQCIAQAGALDPLAALAEAEQEYGDLEPPQGEWPEAARPPDTLIGHTDTLSGEPHPEVLIALIPAAEPWMVPCHLRIGDWNGCPPAYVHAAMFKRWYERYGATVATIADDIIEMQVERPPTTRDEAMLLAREQYLYCPDIVEQGTETLEVLAASLLDGKLWFFWWD